MRCEKCEQDKTDDRFIWKPNGKLARKWCRDCINTENRERYATDPVKRASIQKAVKKWNASNKDCLNEISKRYRERHPERAKQATRNWIERNKERLQEYMRQWELDNRDRRNELRRELYAASPDKRKRVRELGKQWWDKNRHWYGPIHNERNTKWLAENRWYGAHATARRRNRQRRATPVWGQDGIAEMYAAAAQAGMHVDHIVPITHPSVCGLHVIYNLQLLPPTENMSKNNHFDV